MSPTRRDVLLTGWNVGTGLLATAAAWTTYEALAPLTEGEGSGMLTLAAPDAFADGTATFVREGHLYVTRIGDELFALSQKCPHLGCRVPFCDSNGRFACPCHGSSYNLAGEHLGGPAPRGMDRHPLAVHDGRVVVNLTETLDGPPIGSRRFGVPRDGAACESAVTKV